MRLQPLAAAILSASLITACGGGGGSNDDDNTTPTSLINIENVDLQLDIFKKIIEQDLSVRKVEELVRSMGQKPKEVKKVEETPGAGKEIADLQVKLASHFGTRVQVKSDGRKGEIKIPFLSVEDLNRILDILDM